MSHQLVRVRKRYPIPAERRLLPFLDPDSPFLVKATAAGSGAAPDQQKLSRIPLFMREHVYEEIVDFCERSPRAEVGGALIGRYCIDEREGFSRRFLIVEHTLLLPVGRWCSRTEVRFPTQFFWDVDAHLAGLRQEDPGLIRLGLFHSHPGFGVFLSGADRKALTSNFAEDWQVSLILDPFRREEGVFQRRGEGFTPPGPIHLLVPREDSRTSTSFANDFQSTNPSAPWSSSVSRDSEWPNLGHPLFDEACDIGICGAIDFSASGATTPLVLLSRRSVELGREELAESSHGGFRGLLVGRWVDQRTCVAEVVPDEDATLDEVVGSFAIGDPAEWTPDTHGLVLYLPRSGSRPEQQLPQFQLHYVARTGEQQIPLAGFLIFEGAEEEPQAAHFTRPNRDAILPDAELEAEPEPPTETLAVAHRRARTIRRASRPGPKPVTPTRHRPLPRRDSAYRCRRRTPTKPEGTAAAPLTRPTSTVEPKTESGLVAVRHEVVGPLGAGASLDLRQTFQQADLLIPGALAERLGPDGPILAILDLFGTQKDTGLSRSLDLKARAVAGVRPELSCDGHAAVRQLCEALQHHDFDPAPQRALLAWNPQSQATLDDPSFRYEAAGEAIQRCGDLLGEAWLLINRSGCFTYRRATAFSSVRWQEHIRLVEGSILLSSGGCMR